MIPSILQRLMRTLLTNNLITTRLTPQNRLFCLRFVMAHPDWGLAWITERLSPWLSASQYKNIPIQIQRVYSPMFGSLAWCARVLHPDGDWYNLGSVHYDLKIVFEYAFEYIDQMGIGQ
jgi:hypothetical protein